MIALQNVTKKFRNLTVLDNVSLRIEPGEFVCITGPSGAGKSTLLSLLIGALTVTEGSIMVDDVDLRSVPLGALQLFRRRVGMVFQDYKLLQNRTVAENIAFPLEVTGKSDTFIAERVPTLLHAMGLEDKAQSMPQELSGGERARVAVARAVAHQPLILLADEPTGNLDRKQSDDVLQLFHSIHQAGTTVIIATHDQALVSAARARMVVLEHGRIVNDGQASGHMNAQTAKKPAHRVAVANADIEETEPVSPAAEDPPPPPAPVEPPDAATAHEEAAAEEKTVTPKSKSAKSAGKKKRRGPLRRRGDEHMFQEGSVHESAATRGGGHKKVRITSIHSE